MEEDSKDTNSANKQDNVLSAKKKRKSPDSPIQNSTTESENKLRQEIIRLQQVNTLMQKQLNYQSDLLNKYQVNNSPDSFNGNNPGDNNSLPVTPVAINSSHQSIAEADWMRSNSAQLDRDKSHVEWAKSSSWHESYMAPPIPVNDEQRCAAVVALQALDSEEEDIFNNICEIARNVFDTGMAAINIISNDRVWFKASSITMPKLVGFKTAHRCISFCNWVLVKQSVLTVHDVAREPMFANNPLITQFNAGFYSGAPLLNSDGIAVGTFALLDTRPRLDFNHKHEELLQLFANTCIKQLEARQKQVATEQGKSRFLANMSHEIRTPLHGILGLCDLLQQSELTLEQREYVDDAYQQGETLLSLVNDILDFSKLEAGKMLIECVEFNLSELFVNCCRSMQVIASANQIQIQLFHPFPNDFLVRGDHLRIRQILMNLLSNAVKFSPSDSIISVTLKYSIQPFQSATQQSTIHSYSSCNSEAAANEFYLLFSVRDNGIGISPDMQGKIFQAFVQEDDTTTRQFGGTGLGLSISKQLAHLMGGQIWVESAKGAGATFHVSIKLQHVNPLIEIKKQQLMSQLPILTSLSPRHISPDPYSRSNTPSPSPLSELNPAAASAPSSNPSTNNSNYTSATNTPELPQSARLSSSSSGGSTSDNNSPTPRPRSVSSRTRNKLLQSSSHSTVTEHHSMRDNSSVFVTMSSSSNISVGLNPSHHNMLPTIPTPVIISSNLFVNNTSTASPLRINLGRSSVVQQMLQNPSLNSTKTASVHSPIQSSHSSPIIANNIHNSLSNEKSLEIHNPNTTLAAINSINNNNNNNGPVQEPSSNPIEKSTNNHNNNNNTNSALDILIVDDNPINLKIASKILQSEGHRCVSVDGGQKALETAEKQAFHLVLMDCMMNGMDGFECTAELRKLESQKKLPKPQPIIRSHCNNTLKTSDNILSQKLAIVALTASAMPGDKEKCLSSGMDSVITKPFNRATMRIVLNDLITGKLMRDSKKYHQRLQQEQEANSRENSTPARENHAMSID